MKNESFIDSIHFIVGEAFKRLMQSDSIISEDGESFFDLGALTDDEFLIYQLEIKLLECIDILSCK